MQVWIFGKSKVGVKKKPFAKLNLKKIYHCQSTTGHLFKTKLEWRKMKRTKLFEKFSQL